MVGRQLFAAVCCLGFACSMANAEEDERTIHVTVKDHTGQPLKDVRIFPLADKKTINFGTGIAVNSSNRKKSRIRSIRNHKVN